MTFWMMGLQETWAFIKTKLQEDITIQPVLIKVLTSLLKRDRNYELTLATMLEMMI